jgi:hypothetical protein
MRRLLGANLNEGIGDAGHRDAGHKNGYLQVWNWTRIDADNEDAFFLQHSQSSRRWAWACRA